MYREIGMRVPASEPQRNTQLDKSVLSFLQDLPFFQFNDNTRPTLTTPPALALLDWNRFDMQVAALTTKLRPSEVGETDHPRSPMSTSRSESVALHITTAGTACAVLFSQLLVLIGC